MPIYCYTTDDGETVERVFPIGKAKVRVKLPRGKMARRDLQAEHAPRKACGDAWPMQPCVGSGVNANQAGELRKFFKDNGCETEVTKDGDPIYRDSQHRKRALRLRKMHDRSSYC